MSKNNDSVQIINSKSNTTNTDDTHYSVDVANLGGMYAEKIHIIGTESGLGIRNLGHLGASAGDIVIDVNGKVVNSNNIQAKQNITINAKRDIANKGIIYSQKGNITLKSAEKNIEQLGSITAKDNTQNNGNITLIAKENITQQGETLATGNVNYNANRLQADKSALIAAGLHFIETAKGEEKELLEANKNGKLLQLIATEQAVIKGQNLAQNKISIRSKEIDLSESNNKSDHIDLNAENNVISKQAKLSASSSININANKLVNEEGNIVASNVVINTTAVNNTKGRISALEKLTGNILSTFDNTQGQLLSLGNIAIKGKGVLLNNQSGTIASNNNLLIDVKTLENESHIQSNNANIYLQDSFTLNNAFKISKNLNLSTKGNFINNSTLRTGEGLTIQAKHIENKNQAELSSKNTNIASRTLVNRGLIDASQTVIKTSYLDNLGTGRIYGDHIAIEAKQLNNREDTQNAETKSAVIASRERLDLAVGHLLNHDGGSLISLGNMYFGKTLDDKKHSTGNSDFVENSNGLIEAQGDIYFNVNKVKNTHKYLKTEVKEISRTPIYEYRSSGDSKRYLNGTQGLSVEREDNESGGFLGSDAKVRDLYFLRLPDGSKHYYWLEYDYTRSIKETQVLKPLYNEGRILSGGNIYFGSADVENQDSKIISGRTIHFDNVNSLDNKETKGIQITTDSGKVYNKRKGRKCVKKILGKCVDHADTTKTDTWDYNPPEIPKSISLGLWQYAENAKAELANVRDPNASKINDRKVVGSNGDIGKLPTISEIPLPNSNLYKVNPDANSHYLIETDPRFTDRNKWLSSDYMFNQLRSDHQLVQKRLGDGYYEQRLVNEQINQLTGRRFLENYQSDFEQYKALMDSGIYYAKKFNLIPGVALTAEQMKELTTDLVWFVTKKVKLPNGKEVQVLAPEVYLSSRNIKINNKGALISGNQIIATVTGEIKNSGTISGKKITALSANNIHNNSGSIEGERVYLKAEDALTNTGGDLLAKKELIAQAGRIDIQSTIAETVDTGDFYRKEINEQAKIKVGNNGNLVLFAKEDITLKGVDIDNKGSTNINAGNALSLSSITLKNKENFDFSDGNYVYLEQTKQIGNRLNLIGDTKLVGQKAITLAGDSIHSDSNLLLTSSGDITVKETRETENIAFGARDKTKGLLSKTETIVKHKHDYDLAKGTQIDANKILIHSSQGDVNIQGSQIVAENDLAIQGKNITIKEAENRAYSEDFEKTRKSGFSASLKGGVATVGYQRSKSGNDVKQKDEQVITSSLTAKNNISISSKDKLTLNAAQLQAGKDIHLQGKAINLNAVNEKHTMNAHQYAKSSGLSVGITYSPLWAAYEAGKEEINSKGGLKNQSVVGQVMTVADAGYEAIERLSKTVVVKAGTQSHSADQNRYINKAVTGNVSAGNNLVIQATQGDIVSEGTDLQAEGNFIASAKGNIKLNEAKSSIDFKAKAKNKGIGIDTSKSWLKEFGAYHNKDNENATKEEFKVTSISVAGTSTLKAGKNISTQGANIVSDGENTLIAGENIELGTTKGKNVYSSSSKGVGFGSAKISDTERFTGIYMDKSRQNDKQIIHKGTVVGANKGNANLYAGKDYIQDSSAVVTPDGGVNIFAGNDVISKSQDNVSLSSGKTSGTKIGLFAKVSSPLLDLANLAKEVKATVEDDKADERLKALNGALIGVQGYSAYQSIMTGALAKAEAGVGFKHNQSSYENSALQSQGNILNARKNVTIEADKGAIDLSHIDIMTKDEKGNITPDSYVYLKSKQGIKLDSGRDEFKGKNKQSSYGAQVGVGAQVGAGTGVYAYVEAGYQQGKQSYQQNKKHNSHIVTDNFKAETEGDMTLKGTSIYAEKAKANIKGDLNIISQQDYSENTSSQSGANVRAQVSIGTAWGASGTFNQQTANGETLAVTEQAGIFAGKEGYDISADKVSLTGGAIVSTADKSKNRLVANDLSFRDIENYSTAKASGVALMGGFSVNRDQTSAEDKALNKKYRAEKEAKGETFIQANQNEHQSSPLKFGLNSTDVHSDGKYAATKIALVNALGNTTVTENNRSLTKSVISEGNIDIASEQGKAQLAVITKETQHQNQSVKEADYEGLKKEADIMTKAKKELLTAISGQTDGAYHKMFIAEHRMMGFVTDENGEPVKDKERLAQLDKAGRKEAESNGIKDEKEIEQYVEKYRKREFAKGYNIYQLRELSDEERKHIQAVTYTDPTTKKQQQKYVVAFNGIMNDLQAAAKFAVQNYVAETGETGKVNKALYKDIYFVHHPKAESTLSELLIAGYQKWAVSDDNSVRQAVDLMKQKGSSPEGLYLGSHSRGTLTISNALQTLEKDPQNKGILSNTQLKMVGPAANVIRADRILTILQGKGEVRTSKEGSIIIENNKHDPIGNWFFIGGNPATNDTNTKNKNLFKILRDVVGDNSSSHNCHGLGQPQCETDGYRTEQNNGNMQPERTIFELNQKTQKENK
ncbi:hemagglutinin repeat-containing protein [Bisgaardia hudsonensis]|uniref:hemagglutinin repeat-containing protein n=1 Tax=Bisgaardia hudsonensis TaxID=109472 RepID=UPI001047A908|nr:hemagglutinin repeat-containing protein [Bisgaardia hudsonensis]